MPAKRGPVLAFPLFLFGTGTKRQLWKKKVWASPWLLNFSLPQGSGPGKRRCMLKDFTELQPEPWLLPEAVGTAVHGAGWVATQGQEGRAMNVLVLLWQEIYYSPDNLLIIHIAVWSIYYKLERKKEVSVPAGQRNNNHVHVLFEGQLWWWDWLVAVWWGRDLARPQEAALPQCCWSSCNQKLPSARREDKPSKLPMKRHISTLLVLCSLFASQDCECRGLIFFKKQWILFHSLWYIPFSKTKPEQNTRSN